MKRRPRKNVRPASALTDAAAETFAKLPPARQEELRAAVRQELNEPGVHGVGIAPKAGHGFTTNGGNSMVTTLSR